jgi:hypothetical protein
VESLLKKHMQGTSRQQTYRKDVLSHHILRLAYCRTADLRNWLLAQEALLFKFRFKALGRAQQVRLHSTGGRLVTSAAVGQKQQLAAASVCRTSAYWCA